MTETAVIDRPTPRPAKISRATAAKPPTVSASAMAAHLDLSRQYVEKLADTDGVLRREPDGGFLLDQNRVAYVRYLRRERKQSARAEADSEFQKAKTELIRIRIEQRKRVVVPREEANACIDFTVGLVLTKLSGMAARCTRDLAVRRAIDAVIFTIRQELAEECTRLADANGEPPEEDDAA